MSTSSHDGVSHSASTSSSVLCQRRTTSSGENNNVKVRVAFTQSTFRPSLLNSSSICRLSARRAAIVCCELYKGVSPLQLVFHRTSSVSRDCETSTRQKNFHLPFRCNEPRGFHNSLRSRPEANSRSVGAMPHELPAFLKARLKARGIKVDDEANNRGGSAENRMKTLLFLPGGPRPWTRSMDTRTITTLALGRVLGLDRRTETHT